MKNHTYQRYNNIFGWLVFAIAAIVYFLTMERHISFWDTGEYIVSSSKLSITHAPGAAVFQLIGAVWSGLAFGDSGSFPLLINALSAICSAFTILFLFWTISHFSKKIIFSKQSKEINTTERNFELEKNHLITIFSSALVGSLAFTFSDTFWYSAVEGEVYAMASMFTALIVWLACKWDNRANEARADKWLILIALVVGLGVGVHLMSILAIPVVGYIYYVRKYKITIKSFLIANVVIAGILGFVFKIIFPSVMRFFGQTELYVVNELKMPFHSGSLIALALLVGLIFALIHYTKKFQFAGVNRVILAVAFMLIGLSSWLVIPIRANANPHMNLNDPDTALGVLDYFNREQYPSWPTIYGPSYTAHVETGNEGLVDQKIRGAEYKKDNKTKTYKKVADRYEYVYADKHNQFFPKMYNDKPDVMENYANWYGFPEFDLSPAYRSDPQANQMYAELLNKKENGDLSIAELKQNAKFLSIEPPSFAQHLNYFMDYQVGYMFLRYFMWNFSGRQNDWEGHREAVKGNWISGFDFIDSPRLGSQKNIPAQYKNKSTNVYYMLPLLLGLIGFFFQLNRNFGIWWAVLSLFLLTSVGIIFYTSVKPFEPRERDYALVSAFFAFSIWIGLGVHAISAFVQKRIIQSENNALAIMIPALCLSVPILMGFQNWDDHDRSQRTAAKDFANNYLNNLGKDAILFVYGDNDTYPLWGYQETELFRTDVKVVNFTLLGAPWYIEQATRKTYDAKAIPTNLKYTDYQISKNDVIQVVGQEFLQEVVANLDVDNEQLNQLNPNAKKGVLQLSKYAREGKMTAKEAVDFILNKSEAKELLYTITEITKGPYNFLPVSKIQIPVNKENVVKYGIVSASEANLIEDTITIDINQRAFGKSTLAMLSMFANYNWDRAIYFSGGGLYDESNLFYLNDYLQYQGMSYKLVPIKTEFGLGGSIGRINTEELYQTFKGFKWANFNNPKASFDETSRAYTLSYRNFAFRLADALYNENQKQKAKEVLDTVMDKIPMERYFWDSVLARIAGLYIKLEELEKGNEILTLFKEKNKEKIDYFNKLDPPMRYTVAAEKQEAEENYTIALYGEITAYLDIGDSVKAKSKLKAAYKPVEEKLMQTAKKLTNNQRDPKLNAKFDQQFNQLRELIAIGNQIDSSTYNESKLEEVFNLILGEQVQDSVIEDSAELVLPEEPSNSSQ